ncbi:MAG: isoaspartyl peptidase/L-asparaginase, partial [Microbacteriaceae bacterium]|nr:isoaspartyl peptidase/L-asparaginase [Microbacteriaceae bacterium]
MVVDVVQGCDQRGRLLLGFWKRGDLRHTKDQVFGWRVVAFVELTDERTLSAVDVPLVSSGPGEELIAAGCASLDAAIMDGPTRAAGAVAGVSAA